MPDNPPQTPAPATATPDPQVKDDVPLSDHAEDVLAEAVGHGVELVNDADNVPVKTVKEVLTDMVGDKDELSITLEYGTGESGVDQASWEIEITSLQRAFLRKQKHSEIDQLSNQILGAIKTVRAAVDGEWADQTRELREMMKLFEHPDVDRQQIDDYQHRIFGRDTYLGYIESVQKGTDAGRLFNAAANLKQVAQQLEVDLNSLISPAISTNYRLSLSVTFRQPSSGATSRP